MKKEGLATFSEEKGLRFLEENLELEKRIKCRFNRNDKTPLYDGSFNYLSSDREIIKSFDVQIKSTNKVHKLIRGKNKGKYKYEFDRDVLDSIRTKITENPTFYFVVNPEEKIILFKYLSIDFLVSLNYINTKTKVIEYYFDDSDLLSDMNFFYSILETIKNESMNNNVFKSKDEIKYIQQAMDKFYKKLYDIDFIIRDLWPNFWKFGIRTSNYKASVKCVNKNVELGGECSAFAIYPIASGDTSLGIKNFTQSPNNMFVEYDFTQTKTPDKYLDGCLTKIIEFYFNETNDYLQYLPSICLEELSFAFMDGLIIIDDSKRSDEYYNTCNISSMKVADFELELIPFIKIANKIIHKELIFNNENPIMRYFIKYLNNGYVYFDINKIKNVILYNQVLIELKNRKIDIISRPWNYMVKLNNVHFPCYQSELFDDNSFRKAIDCFMQNVQRFLNEIIDRSPMKIKNTIFGTYYYELLLDEKPLINYSMKMAKINDDIGIKIINNRIGDELVYKHSCWDGMIVDLFKGNTPVYNFSRIMFQKMISNKLAIENKGIKINDFIMNKFIIF